MDAVIGKIVNLMLEKEKLKAEKSVYEFGLKVLINESFTFLLTILISIILKQVEFSIIYIFLFSYLREYSGGYHASTYWKCRICYIAMFMLNIISLSFIELKYPIITAFACNFVLWKIAPVDCASKRIVSAEKNYYRNKLLKRQKITMIFVALLRCIDRNLSEIACITHCSVLLLALIQKYKNGREVQSWKI